MSRAPHQQLTLTGKGCAAPTWVSVTGPFSAGWFWGRARARGESCRKSTKRKEQREHHQELKVQEKAKKDTELQRLKKLKRLEILRKLKEIERVSGVKGTSWRPIPRGWLGGGGNAHAVD